MPAIGMKKGPAATLVLKVLQEMARGSGAQDDYGQIMHGLPKVSIDFKQSVSSLTGLVLDCDQISCLMRALFLRIGSENYEMAKGVNHRMQRGVTETGRIYNHMQYLDTTRQEFDDYRVLLSAFREIGSGRPLILFLPVKTAETPSLERIVAA